MRIDHQTIKVRFTKGSIVKPLHRAREHSYSSKKQPTVTLILRVCLAPLSFSLQDRDISEPELMYIINHHVLVDS